MEFLLKTNKLSSLPCDTLYLNKDIVTFIENFLLYAADVSRVTFQLIRDIMQFINSVFSRHGVRNSGRRMYLKLFELKTLWIRLIRGYERSIPRAF